MVSQLPAIILAAGMGTRLGNYTKNLPKCMLQFEGGSLLARQVGTLRSAGINNITIVRGFQPDAIRLDGVGYALNPDYATTNMVATLIKARDAFERSPDGVLICYADIIYEKRLIETITASTADVNVTVDDDWIPYWKARLDNWEEDVESVQYDDSSRLTEIGTPRCKLAEAMSRYVGLIKLSPKGVSAFLKAFDENRAQHWDHDRPWKKSKSFKKAYMTCMIQELVDRKLDVRVAHVKHGWMEFDTVEDYERAQQWVKDGSLNRFIDLGRTTLASE